MRHESGLKVSDPPGVSELATVQAALEAAARRDDAPAIAECLFEHVRILSSLHAGSPLQAVGAGELEHAWELVDLHDPERAVLWHLLLAWELEALIEVGDRERFRRLLLPCAHDPQSAGRMVLLLLKAYPRRAAEVVERTTG
jgi:hypothetical protein